MAVTNAGDHEDFMFSMQLVTASIFPNVMKAAVELDLFEAIAKAGPGAQLSPKEIASHIGAKNQDTPAMLDRMLRLLASYSVLTSSLITNEEGNVERVYGLASVCKYLVQNEDGVSNIPMLLLFQDDVAMPIWKYPKSLILGDFKVGYEDACEIHETDPRFQQVSNNAFRGTTTLLIKKLLEVYQGFEGMKQLLDCGGCQGVTLGLITSKYPSIKGISFDLPHVNKNAPSYPGVEHVGGDMFKSVPKAENIFMKWILHDWSDAKCVTLLKNCYEALPADGKLIIVDLIVPVAAETDTAAKCASQMDIFMMMGSQGKERTEDEFRSLVKEAGFASMSVAVKLYGNGVMECYKK